MAKAGHHHTMATGGPSSGVVALVGRPNVGKSTLFNRISRSRRAIVDPTPGVTRDRQYALVEWKERRFTLVDTGGIDLDPQDMMAGDIRAQALAAIEEADVILFLLDGREGVMPADHQVVELLRRTDTPVFFVVNKIDGPEREEELLGPFFELGVGDLWPVSAEHGYGFTTLMDGVCAGLPDRSVDPGGGAAVSLAFLGRPNVGKSSLVNLIVGQERMVVSALSGTTRDSVDTLLTHKGRSYLLIDTAGIRRKGKTTAKLEKFSVLKALAALGRCDVAVVLLDAAEGITDQDARIIGYTQDQGRALILLINKWDLVADDPGRQERILADIGRAVPFVGFAPVIPVSALTGYGYKRLFPAVGSVHRQFTATFPTAPLNRLLGDAIEHHSPPIYKNKRLKLYYTAQVGTAPPTFVIMTNSSKGVHFSYRRYLANRYRDGLGLDRVPIRLIFKDKQEQRSRRQ